MTTNAKVAKSSRKPPAVRGNRKGVPNKNTAAIKDMILAALDESGGVDYLVARARDPRTAAAFLGLIGKVLPMQVTGVDGEAIKHAVTFEVVGVKAQA